MHTVIGALTFLTEHVNAITLKRTGSDQLLDTVVTDHTVANDDQCLHIVKRSKCGVHIESLAKPIRFFESKKKAPGTFRFQAPLPVLLWVATRPHCRHNLLSPLPCAAVDHR